MTNEESHKGFNENTLNNYDEYTQITSLQKSFDELLHSIDPTGEHTKVQTQLSKAWETITGPSTQEHTIAVFRRHNTIVVWVDNPVWASNIRMLETMYLEKLREALSDASIARVRIEVKRRGRV